MYMLRLPEGKTGEESETLKSSAFSEIVKQWEVQHALSLSLEVLWHIAA
jgi:hypothetical protein